MIMYIADWCDDVFVDENEAKPENDVCDIDNIAIFNDIDDFNQAEVGRKLKLLSFERSYHLCWL